MDLLWKPVVHSPSLVDIPQVAVGYEAAGLEGWKKANKPWLQSDRKDYTVWGKYENLAKTGRFLLPYRNESPTKRFAELHTALLLQREGFHCWGGAHLFKYKRAFGKGKGNTKRNTAEIRSRVKWRWPSDIQDTLNFQPRNPDIVAYSKKRNEWRFCEVKGPGDRVKPDQLGALAVLHLLTGAPVAVVRVVEAASAIALQRISSKIAYRDGAQWIGSGKLGLPPAFLRLNRVINVNGDELNARTGLTSGCFFWLASSPIRSTPAARMASITETTVPYLTNTAALI